ncbi:MAG: hypothetical protein Roseis2KO_10120 [Roseivirga sp.]
MKITWKELTINFNHLDRLGLIESWAWLVGDDKLPILISSIGDMFLEDQKGRVYWLNVGEGTLKLIANNQEKFTIKLNDDDIANELFMFQLVTNILNSGLRLEPGKLFVYKQLPVIGGAYNAENFELTDIEVHFHLAGQIHEKIKDLPDGTKIKVTLSGK